MASLVQRGLVWEGRSPANQHTLPIFLGQILRPLKPRPLPLIVSHWRISLSVFNEEEVELNAARTLSPAQVSSSSRIGQDIIPEWTGSFCFCGLVELFGLLFVKIQWPIYKTQSKALVFHYT